MKAALAITIMDNRICKANLLSNLSSPRNKVTGGSTTAKKKPDISLLLNGTQTQIHDWQIAL